MNNWIVELGGSRFDMQELLGLSIIALNVYEETGRFYLRSAAFDACGEAGEVLLAARGLVAAINGVAQVHFDNWESVHVSGVARIREDGGRDQFMFPTGIRARARVSGSLTVVRADGTVAPAVPSQLEKDLQSILSDTSVSKAFRLYGRHGATWGSLYAIYEIVRDAVGGAITQRGWASTSEITSFTHTANHPDAAGDDARHAVSKESPPRQPMSLDQASDPVKRLLRAWMVTRQT